MKTFSILVIVIATFLVKWPCFSQEGRETMDSLIVRFSGAGRNWNTLADQLIAIGEPAVLPLVKLLQDTSQTQWTRRIAAMTLNDIHSPAYIEPALQLLMDRNEDLVLRNHVTNGLKGYDLSHVSEELWKIYHEEEDHIFRLNIAGILYSGDPVLAYQAYKELYMESEGYPRQQALKNMVRLRPHESLNWYISALQTDDWMTSNLAMDSLVSTANFAAGKLYRLFHRGDTPETVRWRIIFVLGHRQENEYVDLLLEGLSDQGWLVHNEAALALSRMPADLVLPEIRYLAQSPDAQVAVRAGWVINQFEPDPVSESASMQPFEGYPMLDDVEKIRELLRNKCVDTLTFRKGEIIADVGAGNGYLEAMFSLFHDDLTFYVQDIDDAVCNPDNLQEVIDFYEQVKGRPFTNRFIPVIGTDTDTRLPDHTFDKILMLWTYQYLKNPRDFILNLREKLKTGGLFYVINPEQDYEYGKYLSLKNGWNMSTIDRQLSDIIDCGFELVRISRNYDYVELPYIMVFRKK